MKISRLFFILLTSAFAILTFSVIVRWVSNRNTLELEQRSSNVEYTRWQLPKGAKARFGKGSINDIKFSPNGKRFAVGTSIGVWMYDAQSGEEISLLKGDRQIVKGIAFSLDGSKLIGANSAGWIPRWNISNGKLHSILINEKVKTIGSAIFSEDSTKLVCVGGLYDEIQICDIGEIGTSPMIKHIKQDSKSGQITAIALSPDKRFLATAIDEWNRVYPIQIWNAITGEHLSTLTGHKRRIKSLVFSPDGQTLASGEYKTIKVWDMITETSHASFKAPVGFDTLSFSPNGKLLASGCSDRNIRLWNTEAKQEGWMGKINQLLPTLTLKGHKDSITDMIFSLDGKTLLSGGDDGTIRAWETTSGRQKFVCTGHTDVISQLVVSEKGKTIISTHSWNSLLHWNVNVGHPQSGFYFKNNSLVAISPDAKTLVIKDWRGKGQYKLWNISKKHYIATLKGLKSVSLGKIPKFVFSLDGKMLATSITSNQRMGVIHIWNIPDDSRSFLNRLFFTSGTIRPVYTHKDRPSVTSVFTFSPNGNLLGGVSSHNEKTIHLRDVETGSHHFTLTGHSERIRSLAFSPNGTTLASVCDKEIIFWDVTTGRRLRTCTIEKSVRSMLFSPDGKTLICGGYDGAIRLWDTHTENLLSTHIGHTYPITTMLFLEEGKTLVSASVDGTILLWDWEEIAP